MRCAFDDEYSSIPSDVIKSVTPLALVIRQHFLSQLPTLRQIPAWAVEAQYGGSGYLDAWTDAYQSKRLPLVSNEGCYRIYLHLGTGHLIGAAPAYSYEWGMLPLHVRELVSENDEGSMKVTLPNGWGIARDEELLLLVTSDALLNPHRYLDGLKEAAHNPRRQPTEDDILMHRKWQKLLENKGFPVPSGTMA